MVDIELAHPSCSKQHAVIQFRMKEEMDDDANTIYPVMCARARVLHCSRSDDRACSPYVMDIGSTNGTFLNGTKLEPKRYVEMRHKDVLKFGFSTREYVLLKT